MRRSCNVLTLIVQTDNIVLGSEDEDLSAAGRIFKKAVYYVDNIKCSYTAEKVEKFISGNLSAEVVWCYDVNPRKRRSERRDNNDGKVTSRKAFRVCINAADCGKFLDETKWSQDVVVAEWNFKPPKPRSKADTGSKPKPKRSRAESDGSDTSNRQKALRSDDVDEVDATVRFGASDPPNFSHGATA